MLQVVNEAKRLQCLCIFMNIKHPIGGWKPSYKLN